MLTRLSPTPSGYLHTGNIFNFLINWLWARSNNGQVLLRIDDGDTDRKRKEYVEDIFRVLDWLGLDWDIGPTGPGDLETNWSQLKRIALYNDTLDELVKKNQVFACGCSRKEVCHCAGRHLSLSQKNVAWKMRVPDHTEITFTDKMLGDTVISIGSFVIRKKDGFAAYQVCSLADDRHFGVTHICRGDDLKASTAMQLFANKFIQPAYLDKCSFWHHPLINNINGGKLSKSAGAAAESITKNTTKEKLLVTFATWMGWEPAAGTSLQEMMQQPVFINSR